jgi:hypothetical protein
MFIKFKKRTRHIILIYVIHYRFFPLKFVRWLKEFGDQGIVPQYDPNS